MSRSGISIKGKKSVVVGRSNIVRLHVSLILLKEDATVTIVHSRTKEPEKIIREADVVIAAAGQANMVPRYFHTFSPFFLVVVMLCWEASLYLTFPFVLYLIVSEQHI